MSRQISDLHVDQPLTNLAIDFVNGGFVANDLFPVFPVDKESDKYYLFTRREAFQASRALRAPNAPAAVKEWSLTTGSFACDEYALAGYIGDRERGNADAIIDLDGKTTLDLMQDLLLGQEIRVATIVTDTAVLTQNTTLSGGNQWGTDTSDPLGAVRTGRAAIHAATGKNPTIMVVGRQVHDQLVDHPDLVERIKHSQLGVVTPQLMAQLFEVDQYRVAEAIKDTANEGQSSATLSYAFGKNCVLAYVDPSPGPRTLSLGWTFSKRRAMGAGGQPSSILVKRFRNEPAAADVIEASQIVVERLVSLNCGYLIKDAVA